MAVLQLGQVSEYFRRIGLEPSHQLFAPTLENLSAMQLAHVRSIPWDNISIMHPQLRSLPMRLDADSVYDKIVVGKLGGNCYEGHSLLAAVLRTIGFELYEFGARVVSSIPASDEQWTAAATHLPMSPLNHRVIMVMLDGDWWIVDTGLGAHNPSLPVRLAPPTDTEEERKPQVPNGMAFRCRVGCAGSTAVPDEEYRLRYPYRIGWYLQRLVESEWKDLYFFKEDEYYDTDWPHLNYATCYQPGGFFTTKLLMAIQTEGGKVTLDDYKLRVKQGETFTLTHLENDEERDRAITKYFGIEIP